MKVLLLSNLYPSPHEPTRGMFNKQVFGALSQFCDVQVVSPLPWWTRAKKPMELFKATQSRSTGLNASYPVFWSLPKVAPGLHGNAMYYSLRRYIARLRAQFPFDVIIAAWAYPDAFAAARLAHDFNCPLVTKLMGSDINDLATRPELREPIRWCLNQSSTVVAVSHALRDRVVEMGVAPNKVVVHHNGVNGHLFTPRDKSEVRCQLGLPLDRKFVVYIGNFYPVKGTDILIEAMGHLSRVRQDVDLLLVGSGTLEKTLMARVDALGLQKRVTFCGRKPHDEIPLWMSAGDVFCLPSRNEGCPNVVLEALASGRPVVASRVGGIPELLNSENGFLVPSNDAMPLASGLCDALQHEWNEQELRNSVEFLSWDKVGTKYHQIITKALEDWRTTPLSAKVKDDSFTIPSRSSR